LRLVAVVEDFVELGSAGGIVQKRSAAFRGEIAKSLALHACTGPTEQRCTEAAQLLALAGYGDYAPIDLLAVYTDENYSENVRRAPCTG
jgi:hypothetical protein